MPLCALGYFLGATGYKFWKRSQSPVARNSNIDSETYGQAQILSGDYQCSESCASSQVKMGPCLVVFDEEFRGDEAKYNSSLLDFCMGGPGTRIISAEGTGGFWIFGSSVHFNLIYF